MTRNIFAAVLLFAFLLVSARAEDQASSGHADEGFASSGDESNEGSGFNGQEVQKVIETMRKMSKNKSDEDLSKNIKTGARQVMHSIVEKLVTHTGEKVSNQVASILKTNTASGGAATMQKSSMPDEKNALDQTSQNDTTTVTQSDGEAPGEEDIDSGEKTTNAGTPANNRDKDDKSQQAMAVQETNNYHNNEDSGNQVTSPGTNNEQKLASYSSPDSGNTAAVKPGTQNDVKSSLVQNQATVPKQGKAVGKDVVKDNASEGSYLTPQEQTPESITANMGVPPVANVHRTDAKVKHVKSRKRYKMHKHTRTGNKSTKHLSRTRKETRVKYRNVDKHLIRKFKGHEAKVPGNDLSLTQGSLYEAPISKQLESVLNAEVARGTAYSKTNSNHMKRSFPTENRRSNIEHVAADSYDDYYDYSNDDSGDEASGKIASTHRRDNGRSYGQSSKGKKRKTSKRRKGSKAALSKRKSALKTIRQSGQALAYLGNRTLPTKPMQYEAPVRKFRFFGVQRQNVEGNNSTAVPILNIESAPTNKPTESEPSQEGGNMQPPPMLQSGDGWSSKEQPGPFGMAGQSSDTPPFTPEPSPAPNMDGPPVLLPQLQQPEDVESPIVLPTASGKPIVPIVPTEAPVLPGEEDDESNDNNSTSFLHPDETQSLTADKEALTEELRSLESRMTVVEAAVAEIIEWIRNRSLQPHVESLMASDSPPVSLREPSTTVRLRPTTPLEEPTAEQELPVPHHRRLLKQIFIPLPAPNSEAEMEIEKGEPINGLPFPLNFIVTKILAKMLKQRDEKIVATAHPHTPVPDVDIPAIEHDINRLEMELGSVPKPFHHRKHHQLKLQRTDADARLKSPIVGELLGTVSLDDGPACSSPCQNGGICTGNNICRCPTPFSGPSCGSVTLVKVAKPSRRIMVQAPGADVLEALRRRAIGQYAERHLPGKIRDNRERRMLVHVLKRLLHNIAAEDIRPEYRLRNSIEVPHEAADESDDFARAG